MIQSSFSVRSDHLLPDKISMCSFYHVWSIWYIIQSVLKYYLWNRRHEIIQYHIVSWQRGTLPAPVHPVRLRLHHCQNMITDMLAISKNEDKIASDQ